MKIRTTPKSFKSRDVELFPQLHARSETNNGRSPMFYYVRIQGRLIHVTVDDFFLPAIMEARLMQLYDQYWDWWEYERPRRSFPGKDIEAEQFLMDLLVQHEGRMKERDIMDIALCHNNPKGVLAFWRRIQKAKSRLPIFILIDGERVWRLSYGEVWKYPHRETLNLSMKNVAYGTMQDWIQVTVLLEHAEWWITLFESLAPYTLDKYDAGIHNRMEPFRIEEYPFLAPLPQRKKHAHNDSSHIQKEKIGMKTIKLFMAAQDVTLVTECVDEREFLDQLAILFAKTWEKEPTMQAEDLTEFFRRCLPLAVDLCCKYRGYKSQVTERKMLIAGDSMFNEQTPFIEVHQDLNGVMSTEDHVS